ncbi:hypothetical protein BDW62DRAFT_213791 [Aspergillus aurantiobrunneus]
MHYWLDRPQRDGVDADEWKPATDSEAAANIDKWYHTGRPLFPRDSLVSIRDQLRKPLAKGDFIFVKALDGLAYEYPVKTGKPTQVYVFDDDEANDDETKNDREPKTQEGVLGAPQIYYNSYESLKRDLEWSLSRAYFPIGIARLVKDLDAGLESFDAILQEWEDSSTWKEIKSTLLSLGLEEQIGKVIGMACGGFTATSEFKGSKRSAIQNAFLVSLKRMFQESDLGIESLGCYVQDPLYTRTDEAVLEKSDIKVVEDPEGFLEMDDASLVFSCAPNICVKQIIADIARPAILIWCALQEEDPECISFPFPEDNGDNFTSMAIYVRQDARIGCDA